MVEKVIIIGSGPAGYAAAIYCVRNGLDPLLIRGYQSGGQLMLTSYVENYPGFRSILGTELMDKMFEHAKSLGCRTIDKDVSSVDLSSYPYKINVEDDGYETYSIIISTGASSKWLGLESEKRLIGKGVSGCAVCDGPFFKNRDVVVVGGGDSAMEDALFLANMAKSVTIVHRRDSFKASKVMQERALSNPKIKVVWNSEIKEILGKDKVEAVVVEDVITGKESRLVTGGVFIAIGHSPNTSLFNGQLELDESGYIKTRESTRTSKDGVFAAGDVQDRRYKQAVVAAGWGCMAALDVFAFLNEKKPIG